MGISESVHLDVPSRESRCRVSGIFAHVFEAPPPFTFVKISAGVYIESPAAALVSNASSLSHGELMCLINQALGCFAIQRGSIIQCEPLLTADELRTYAQSAKGRRGAKRVRALLGHAVGGTASPAEARIAALLTLSPRLGGYGLPLPEANAPVDVIVGGAKGAVRYIDLLWRKWKLGLEYDSDAFHVGADKIGMDSDRRAVLQNAGYTVVTLTNLQLKDRGKFEDVVRALFRAMGRDYAPDRLEDFDERTLLLRSQLRAARTFNAEL